MSDRSDRLSHIRAIKGNQDRMEAADEKTALDFNIDVNWSWDIDVNLPGGIFGPEWEYLNGWSGFIAGRNRGVKEDTRFNNGWDDAKSHYE